MTLEDIADFCEFMDCQVTVGSPDTGYVRIDGTGLEDRSYTYGRFRMLNEVSALASPTEVLSQATIFKIVQGQEEHSLNRRQFESEFKAFRKKVSGKE